MRDAAPILTAGQPGEWDEGFVSPHSVIRTDDGYVMYYSGGNEFLLPLPRLIGLAYSKDGLTWTKYNDPTTTDPRYANSDPILEVREGESLPFAAWAVDISKTAQGWEMFFSGTCPDATKQDCPGFIAYATSTDGIRWQAYRSPDWLVLTPKSSDSTWSGHCVCYPSALRTAEGYQLYYTGCTDQSNDCQIGLAVGKITWK